MAKFSVCKTSRSQTLNVWPQTGRRTELLHV